MAKRRTLGRRLLWGILGYVVTSLGALATTYLTSLDVSPLVGSLLATGVGLVLVVIGVLMDHAQDGEELPPRPSYPTPYPYPSPYQPPSRPPVPRRSIATVLVVILLLCGAGGFAVAYGAQWAGQRAIAFFEEQSKSPSERKLEDPGVERLGGTTSNTAGVVTLTVTSVRVNDQVTVLTVTATNQGSDPLTLPLFGNAQLTVPGSATLQPDPSVGTWANTVPAGGDMTGTIVFDGVLGPQETQVTLSFTTIYGSLNGPRSMSMDIPISPAT
jgi:hypothetical protein